MKLKIFRSKKILTILFFTLALIVTFFSFEYYSYQCIYADESKVSPSTKEHGEFGLPKPSLSAYLSTYFTNNNKLWSIRDVYVENEESEKAPILLLGDEVAMGLELNREDELSYQLAKKTGRPVYNRAVNCPPMQTALKQVRDKELYKQIPKSEYVIFTFIVIPLIIFIFKTEIRSVLIPVTAETARETDKRTAGSSAPWQTIIAPR